MALITEHLNAGIILVVHGDSVAIYLPPSSLFRHLHLRVPNNRRFPEITGEYNLTVFSYSGRVKSPEWRWQWRTADLRNFEIFRRGPIVIYTRLLAGKTYYPICTFPTNSECLMAFLMPILPLFTGIRHLAHVLSVPPTKAWLLCATPAGMDLYIYRPCLEALTECSPLDFRRSSIDHRKRHCRYKFHTLTGTGYWHHTFLWCIKGITWFLAPSQISVTGRDTGPYEWRANSSTSRVYLLNGEDTENKTKQQQQQKIII